MTYSYWRTERLVLDAVDRRILRRATISDRIVSALSNTDLLVVAAFCVIGLFASLAATLFCARLRPIGPSTPATAVDKEFANIGRNPAQRSFSFRARNKNLTADWRATDELLQNRRFALLEWARR